MAKVQLSTRKGEDEFGGTISQAYTGKKAKNWEKQIYRGRRTKSTLGEIGTPRASRGNPLGPNRSHRDIHRRHVLAKRKPTEEIVDLSKVALVSDISYLFSTETN
ncbi:uncharacterized protein LOC114186865 [Vigna unguiculata]|uniref:uncharacterized protein LOC114186865 n=1 Tax=Vigna unguiculata TaxID=3917 RepID=UPI001016FE69|nr:uncharacterized protein LOC114186865 [Vigna unguiculata]